MTGADYAPYPPRKNKQRSRNRFVAAAVRRRTGEVRLRLRACSEHRIALSLAPCLQCFGELLTALRMGGIVGEVVALVWVVRKVKELFPLGSRIEDVFPPTAADHPLAIGVVAEDFFVVRLLLPAGDGGKAVGGHCRGDRDVTELAAGWKEFPQVDLCLALLPLRDPRACDHQRDVDRVLVHVLLPP